MSDVRGLGFEGTPVNPLAVNEAARVAILGRMDGYLKGLGGRVAILGERERVLGLEVASLEASLEGDRVRGELLKRASLVLGQVVEVVSVKNLERVEGIVNSALRDIFFDMDLRFKLVSEVKRGVNVVRVELCEGGVEGCLSSFGGGVLAVVAMVLKVVFNRFAGRASFLAFDESLAFLSEKYIAGASRFIRGLSVEFGMPLVFVTHQGELAKEADNCWEVYGGVSGSSVRKVAYRGKE